MLGRVPLSRMMTVSESIEAIPPKFNLVWP